MTIVEQLSFIQSLPSVLIESLKLKMKRIVFLIALFAAQGVQCRSVLLPSDAQQHTSFGKQNAHFDNVVKREKKSTPVCADTSKFSIPHCMEKPISSLTLSLFSTLFGVSFLFRKIPPNMSSSLRKKLAHKTRHCRRLLQNIDRYQPHQFIQVIISTINYSNGIYSRFECNVSLII